MGALGQASQYDYLKRQSWNKASMTRANGRGRQNKAYADAAGVEQAERLNAELRGQMMRQERRNQSAEKASARVGRAGSGFMISEGTGDAAENQVAAVYDREIANMAQSSSIASLNAQQRAIDLRRSGNAAKLEADIEAMGYDAEAAQYRAAARNTRRGVLMSGLAGAIGGVAGGIAGYGTGGLSGMVGGATNGGIMGWDMASGFNPYMAGYGVDMQGSYGNMFSLLGWGNPNSGGYGNSFKWR